MGLDFSDMGKSYYVEGYGCPSNAYDMRIAESMLESRGFYRVESPEKADFVFVNTCAVKKRTQDRVLSRLQELRRLAKPVVVGGCLPVIDLEAVQGAMPDYLAVIGPNSLGRLEEALNSPHPGLCLNLLETEHVVKVGKATVETRGVVGIVPIAEGCLGNCTFCCTRFARGRLFSYPTEAIVGEVEKGVKLGLREFWLVGQDTGAYGLDCGKNLPLLLSKVCDIDGRFMVRVGMMNPEHCIPIVEELATVLQNPKMFKFLHLPLQSGNDTVLKAMGRRYRVDEFSSAVETLRDSVKDLTLWTDMICGFPSEDEAAFDDSLKVICEVRPDTVNVSKFSPRPGTAAAGMKMLRSQVVKNRSRKMAHLWSRIALERNQSLVGWHGQVLIDEQGKDGSWIGRSPSYKPVALREGNLSLGQWVEAEVKSAEYTHLLGELVRPR